MGLLPEWTARTASGPGLVAGCAAVLLWPGYAIFQGILFAPFVIALGLCAFCGTSILILTIVDFRNNRRGRRVRPIRAFDILFGLMLAVPSGFALSALLR